MKSQLPGINRFHIEDCREPDILKDEPSDVLAIELELNYMMVLQLRRKLQDKVRLLQSEEPVLDFEAESDELFHAKCAGKKGDKHSIR